MNAKLKRYKSEKGHLAEGDTAHPTLNVRGTDVTYICLCLYFLFACTCSLVWLASGDIPIPLCSYYYSSLKVRKSLSERCYQSGAIIPLSFNICQQLSMVVLRKRDTNKRDAASASSESLDPLADNVATLGKKARSKSINNRVYHGYYRALLVSSLLVLFQLWCQMSYLLAQDQDNNLLDTPQMHRTYRTVPPNMCIYYVVRFNTASWTQQYLEEFQYFMSHLLVRGWQQQTMKGAVPVLDGDNVTNESLSQALLNLGWVPGKTVADHVKERDNSPGRQCEWIVQSRVDADDYLGIQFVETVVDMLVNEIEYANEGPGFCGEWWKGQPCGITSPPPALTISQPRLTRVYLFGDPNGSGKRKCLFRRRNYFTTPSEQPSTGLTLAVTKKIYDDYQQPSILIWTHDKVLSGASKKWNETRYLFFPADGLMMAPVTSLSGHFPWFFDSSPYHDCVFKNISYRIGEENAHLLVTMPLPNVTLLDVCLSNLHARGIMARNVKFKYKTCSELNAHLLEMRLGASTDNATQLYYPWPW